MRDILAELTAALDCGRECVYCAVVETRGSTPQKAGAAMLVFPDGSQRGTLGGGCVEAEVRQRALRSMGSDRPQLHTFCLDDHYGWDDGLICGGRMSILADPITRAEGQGSADGANSGAGPYYRRLRELAELGRGCTEVVVLADQEVRVPVGSRFLFDGEGRPVAQSTAGPIPEQIAQHLVPLQQRPRPCARHGLAYLPLLPRITL